MTLSLHTFQPARELPRMLCHPHREKNGLPFIWKAHRNYPTPTPSQIDLWMRPTQQGVVPGEKWDTIFPLSCHRVGVVSRRLFWGKLFRFSDLGVGTKPGVDHSNKVELASIVTNECYEWVGVTFLFGLLSAGQDFRMIVLNRLMSVNGMSVK